MCSASTPAAVGFARSIAHPPITNGWLVMTAFASGASIPTSAFGAGIVTAADCAVHALVTVLSAYATTVYVPAARCVVDIVNDAYPNRAPNAAAMSARYAPYGAAPRKIGSPPAHGYAHTCTVLTPLRSVRTAVDDRHTAPTSASQIPQRRAISRNVAFVVAVTE